MKNYLITLLFYFVASHLWAQSKPLTKISKHNHSESCTMKVYEYTTPSGERKQSAGCVVTTEDDIAQMKLAINIYKGLPDVITTTTHRALATINVVYNNFGAAPQALAAFQYAVDIWSSQLNSAVTIEMIANWAPLGAGVLGSAGTTARYQNFINAPFPNIGYPAALANAVAGVDLNTSLHDINANFNSNFPTWYFGTDANPAPNQYDFVSVVLHELGHGLGFQGTGFYNTVSLEGSLNSSVFDKFIKVAGVSILTLPNPSLQLGTAIVGGALAFDGPETTVANFGVSAPTHAPTVYAGGSSYSHWSEGEYLAGDVNSLMTPSIGPGEANHEIGAITRAAFRDMGWIINNGTTITVTPTVTVSSVATSCAGQSRTFTATSTGGGAKPAYQWITSNGTTDVVVGKGSSYTTSNILNGTQVKVRMVSVNPNASPISVTSTPIVAVVVPTDAPTVAVTASATIIQIGQSVTFTSTFTSGGTSPVFVWLRNDVSVQSGTSSTYTANNFSDGDNVRVVMTSNSQCTNVGSATSNRIVISLAVVSAQDTEIKKLIKVYPNPFVDAFQIDKSALGQGEASLAIYDILGRKIMNWKIVEQNSLTDLTKLVNGCYVLEIQQSDKIVQVKIIKQ